MEGLVAGSYIFGAFMGAEVFCEAIETVTWWEYVS